MKQEFSHKASPGGPGKESAKGASLTRGIPLSSETMRSLYVCVCAKSLQSCPTLCDPMDCGLPGSSIHGILWAKILEWVAMSSSRGSSRPRIEPGSLMSPASVGGFFTTNATWEAPWGAWDVPKVRGRKTGSAEAPVAALLWAGPWSRRLSSSVCSSTRGQGSLGVKARRGWGPPPRCPLGQLERKETGAGWAGHAVSTLGVLCFRPSTLLTTQNKTNYSRLVEKGGAGSSVTRSPKMAFRACASSAQGHIQKPGWLRPPVAPPLSTAFVLMIITWILYRQTFFFPDF